MLTCANCQQTFTPAPGIPHVRNRATPYCTTTCFLAHLNASINRHPANGGRP